MVHVRQQLHTITLPSPTGTDTDTLADMQHPERTDDARHGFASDGYALAGYGSSTYGDRFADIYDQWYHDVSDVESTVAAIARLHPQGRVLELGVGTGRIAIPLAQAGLRVDGIDSSAAMLERLNHNDPANLVQVHHGDMITDSPPGLFDVILIAFNTIFNLPTPQQQSALCAAMATRLNPTGRFIVEAYIPEASTTPSSEVTLRSMTADHVVLSVSRHDPVTGRAQGQFIEISEVGGVRLRPWVICPITIAELDQMAQTAGFVLEQRWQDFSGQEFTEHSDRHVSIYRLS
jgi:SAM-dependent methyltransferase